MANRNRPNMRSARSLLRPLFFASALLGLVLLSTATNWGWVQTNVVLVGRDSTGHLEKSLEIADRLASGGGQALFQAITLDSFRPPLLYLLTQPAYAVWGRSLDVAQIPNLLLFALILLLTFWLARRTVGDGWALLAVALLSLLPMATAMTRLYYMENSLAAPLLAAFYALLRSERFRHRGWSIGFGGALGIALLSKWTAPLYLALPLLYLLWTGNFWQLQRSALRSWQPRGAAVGGALGVGFLLALAWYWPNREFVVEQEMFLGEWLLWPWTLLFALALYALWSGRGQIGNGWTAVTLALAIASLWYLPRLDVLTPLGDVAFGTDRGTKEPPNLWALAAYTRYLEYGLFEHLGVLASWVILPAALVGWVARARQPVAADLKIYGLAVVSAWLPLTVLTYTNPRNLVPLLPLLVILLVAGLSGYPRKLAAAVAVAWLGVLLVQGALFTFDRLAPLYAWEPQLWVQSEYSVLPATGSTDPAYWIGPDVLATVGSPEGDAESLGVLIDTWEIHRGKLRYLVALDKLNITVNALTEQRAAGWGQALANRWILLKDGDNRDVQPAGQAILTRIAQKDSLFHQLYEPVKQYPLPDGSTATLYSRDWPRQPEAYPVILIETSPIADALNLFDSSQATLIFGDRDIAVWTAVHDLAADRVLLPGREDAAYPVPLEQVRGTIFVVSRHTQGAREQVAADSYFARTVVSGETLLEVFGRPRRPLQALAAHSPWAALDLDALRSLAQVAPGEVLPVELEMSTASATPLKLSVRLLAADGTVVAQNDLPVEPAVRLGLLVPPGTPSGEYKLGAVLYDPATLAEVATRTGESFGTVAPIQVVEALQPGS
ncbi:MAG: glycosyltransferase family 39 protein [Caldilinea sp.]